MKKVPSPMAPVRGPRLPRNPVVAVAIVSALLLVSLLPATARAATGSAADSGREQADNRNRTAQPANEAALDPGGEGSCGPASSTAFTGAEIDAPFFVFDGAGQGPGLGQFDRPMGIAYLGAGLLGIADAGNDRIKVVTTRGYFQDFIGGTGTEPSYLRQPSSLVVDRQGAIWVVDPGNHRVQRLSFFRDQVSEPKGTFLQELGPTADSTTSADTPWALAHATTDPEGRLYITHPAAARIERFDAEGKALEPWGPASGVALEEPFGITLDARGHFYVTDRAASRVVELSAEGEELARWGEPGSDEGQLLRPMGLVTGPEGHVYVADSGNHRVQKFDRQGRFVASVGCRGKGAGQFSEPSDVTLDRKHHLYVVDTGNHRIQKLGHQ